MIELLTKLNPIDPEPIPDIAICSECGWRGPASECESEQDGDWETGYYDVHVCPKCDSGGCIDAYDMSEDQLKKWNAWDKRNGGGDDAGEMKPQEAMDENILPRVRL